MSSGSRVVPIRPRKPHQPQQKIPLPSELIASELEELLRSSESLSLSTSESTTNPSVTTATTWDSLSSLSSADSFTCIDMAQQDFIPCLGGHESAQPSPWPLQAYSGSTPGVWSSQTPSNTIPTTTMHCEQSGLVYHGFTPVKSEAASELSMSAIPASAHHGRPPSMEGNSYFANDSYIYPPFEPLNCQTNDLSQTDDDENQSESASTEQLSEGSLEDYSQSRRAFEIASSHQASSSNPYLQAYNGTRGHPQSNMPTLESYVHVAKSSKRIVNRGKEIQHDRESGSTESIFCPICSQRFGRKSNLRHHLKIHAKNRRVVRCAEPDCKKTYGRQADLTRHIKSFHEKRLFVCGYCHKQFNRSDILNRHISNTCLRVCFNVPAAQLANNREDNSCQFIYDHRVAQQ